MAHRAERSPLWTKSLHTAIFDEPSSSSTPSPHTTLDGYVTAHLLTPLSSIGAMTLLSTDATSHRSTSSSEPRPVPAPLRLEPVQPLFSPVSASAAQSPAQSPACLSVTSASCRRSLGSEMGLTPRESKFDEIEEDAVDDQELSFSVELSEEDLQDHNDVVIAFDSENAYVCQEEASERSISSAPVTPTRTQNNSVEGSPYLEQSTPSHAERQIVLIEMDEEQPYEAQDLEEERRRTVSILPSLGSPFTVHDPYLPCSDQDDPRDPYEDEVEDQETCEPLVPMQPYQPYHPSTAHYLEPVEEVTEEATLADSSGDCTQSVMLYERTSDRSAASSSTTRQSPRDRTANATDTVASTSTPFSMRSGSGTPNKAVIQALAGQPINMREWEQLHGLGTPSSTFSSPRSRRFGWADVIASVPPPPPRPVVPKRGCSLARLSSNDSLVSTLSTRLTAQQPSANGVRTVCSPERLLGLQSSFWITSPVTLTLGHTLRNTRLMERTAMRSVTMPTTPLNRSDRDKIRLSIESARSLDESGWAHVTAYSRKDDRAAAGQDDHDDQINDDYEDVGFYHHNSHPGNPRDQTKGKVPHRWTQRWARMATSHSTTLSSLRSAR